MAQYYLDERDQELVTLAKRAALESVVPQLEQLQHQNNQLHGWLSHESRRALDQRVAALVPEYQQIDSDPRWHDWLRNSDSLSGRPRQALLDDAIANRDAHRVAQFFKQFLREAGAGAGGASSSSSQQSFPSGQIYTRDSIKKIYDAHRKGPGGRHIRGPERWPG
jgi:hypothetical protein